jgi:hypothetical protein
MKTRILAIALAGMVTFGLQANATAGQFHFNLGLNYVDGLNDVSDGLEELYTSAGYIYDESIVIPVGLTFEGYYEFDFGLGIGAALGPCTLIALETTSGGSSDTDLSYIIPLGIEARYTFFRDKNVSPYVKAGARFPVVGGDRVDSADTGFFGAVGVEFWRTKAVGMGLEFSYDTSQVTLVGPGSNPVKKDVDYPGWSAAVFVRF